MDGRSIIDAAAHEAMPFAGSWRNDNGMPQPMRNPLTLRGTIVLDNAPGRALRKVRAAVHAADVIYCAGGFHAGDPVYVTFRGADGGQYLVATGIVRCDAADLQYEAGEPSRAVSGTPDERRDDDIVIREADVELLWPPG